MGTHNEPLLNSAIPHRSAPYPLYIWRHFEAFPTHRLLVGHFDVGVSQSVPVCRLLLTDRASNQGRYFRRSFAALASQLAEALRKIGFTIASILAAICSAG